MRTQGLAARLDAGVEPPLFSHAALLYEGDEEFLTAAIPYLQAGLDAGEPALVSVSRSRLRALDAALGPAARSLIRYSPMSDLGRNPAWLIPAWRDFVAPHLAEGRRSRGIEEVIDGDRTSEELVECHRHESLLNLALADAAGFSLLCSYDVGALDAAVLDQARRTHPKLCSAGHTMPNAAFEPSVPAQLTDPLEDAPPWAESATFGREDAWSVRHRISAVAADAGLDAERREDLAVAVSEALTNTVEHGGGGGEIVWWSEPELFLCEIRDRGTIPDPLVGRVRPGVTRGSGRGMWLIHQLCDLVQIRHLPGGTNVVRLHLSA